MKFLKPFKKMNPNNSLKGMLHEHLTGFEPHRGVDRIHASELTKEGGFCPRFYAIADKEQKVLRDPWLTTSEQVTYRLGRELQDAVAHWFADIGKAICHWKCLACGRLHEFQGRPFKCEKPGCGCKTFQPIEPRFESKISGASCGIDLLVSLKGEALTIVEIKTMDKDQFKDLKAPLAEHKLRTNMYMRIVEESADQLKVNIDTQNAKLLYTTKGGYGCADPYLTEFGSSDKFSPFKEYDVVRDDVQTTPYLQRAAVVKAWRDGKIGMPTGICSTALVPRAKKCSACTRCFSGEYPAQFDWKAQ